MVCAGVDSILSLCFCDFQLPSVAILDTEIVLTKNQMLGTHFIAPIDVMLKRGVMKPGMI